MNVFGKFFWGLLMTFNLATNAKENEIIHYSSEKDTVPVNILIINFFDAMSMKSRKNKKELFRELADSLKQVLYMSIPPPADGKLIIINELISNSGNSDSTIFLLMDQNNASKAIVIKSVDAFFNQTNVEVTREEDGKRRTAFYDICADINYQLYNKEKKVNTAEIRTCEFFTKRNVMSGLLSAGPDIVGKKEQAFKIVRKNALDYLSKETPWK